MRVHTMRAKAPTIHRYGRWLSHMGPRRQGCLVSRRGRAAPRRSEGPGPAIAARRGTESAVDTAQPISNRLPL